MRLNSIVAGLIVFVWIRLSSTPSPMIPSILTLAGPMRSGDSSSIESSVRFADIWSFGSSTRYPFTRGNTISRLSRCGVIARMCVTGLGGLGGATTGSALKSKGTPSTSAYSTSNNPCSFRSYECLRSALPTTCSHSS